MANTLIRAAVLLLLGGLTPVLTVVTDNTNVASSGSFDWVGCYTDAVANRALTSDTLVNYNTMTVEICAGFCASYSIFGVEYGGECYCGNALQGGSVSAATGDCNMLCYGDQNEYCGGSNRLDLYTNGGVAPKAAAGPSYVATAGAFSWSGCYTDSINSRALVDSSLINYNTMTVEMCANFCTSYNIFGVEYSGECYCGNTLQGGSVLSATEDCNMICDGNHEESCGGSSRLDLYTKGGGTPVVPAGPSHVPTAGGFNWTGCYTDSMNSRALVSNTLVNYNTMTVEICAAFCASYNIFGVEYSGECYCGNTLQGGSVLAATGDCNMLCDGNQYEYCGGPNRLDLYTTAGNISTTTTASTTTTTVTGGPTHVANAGNYRWLGCYTDAIGNRALASDVLVNYDTMTVEICAAYCAPYSMFGVEYSGECYCGNALQGGSTVAATSDCNKLCDGSQTEYCGGSNRLDVYNGTATSVTLTTVGSSPVNNLPAGWAYDGCWVDSMNARILGSVQPDNQQLTVESCINTCIGLGFTVAGMEFAYQCFCDNAVINNGAQSLNQKDCNSPCTGNATEMCGGSNRLSIYNTGTLSVSGPPPPPATQTGGIGNWTYKSCRTDDIDDRTLPLGSILQYNNTAENCLNLCAGLGYTAAGLEYADECYCGDISAVQAGDSSVAADTDCTSVCSGNSSAICGGANRLSYYEWTGPPFNISHTTTGSAAGGGALNFHALATTPYNLVDTYDYTNFFDEWNFFTDPDPTHGFVSYQSYDSASTNGLASIVEKQVYFGADSTTKNPPSPGRASTRVTSNKAYTHGLFIADIAHMPASTCGSWPAFWSFGPDWPSSGEIDIIEGVNTANTNTITLHSTSTCVVNNAGSISGTTTITNDCSSGNSDTGCSSRTSAGASYGSDFNAAGGGVYAMQWESTGIYIWFWPRGSIPADAISSSPNATTWGLPLAAYNSNGSPGCDFDAHFANHNLVFDTTFCGDWAGAVWGWGSCASLASSCEAYVAENPAAFAESYWAINSVNVFQL